MNLIAIGKWDGDFPKVLALITPYHTEVKVWIAGSNRLCLEEVDENDLDIYFKPKSKWFISIPLGGIIQIPSHYEPDFNRTVSCPPPGEEFVW